MKQIQSICVYCGSSNGNQDIYKEAAITIGRLMAQNGIRLIYGGGTNGLMGAVAQAVSNHGGKVTGIIPDFLMSKEANEKDLAFIDELIVTETMHQRKTLMFERSDAFITLPGGIGTLEEIVEIMTWAQLGHHDKLMVFANIDGYWDPMTKLLEHMAQEGFIHTHHKLQPLVMSDAKQIVDTIITQAQETSTE